MTRKKLQKKKKKLKLFEKIVTWKMIPCTRYIVRESDRTKCTRVVLYHPPPPHDDIIVFCRCFHSRILMNVSRRCVVDKLQPSIQPPVIPGLVRSSLIFYYYYHSHTLHDKFEDFRCKNRTQVHWITKKSKKLVPPPHHRLPPRPSVVFFKCNLPRNNIGTTLQINVDTRYDFLKNFLYLTS